MVQPGASRCSCKVVLGGVGHLQPGIPLWERPVFQQNKRRLAGPKEHYSIDKRDVRLLLGSVRTTCQALPWHLAIRTACHVLVLGDNCCSSFCGKHLLPGLVVPRQALRSSERLTDLAPVDPRVAASGSMATPGQFCHAV
eukprot:s1163_g10.t1